MKNLFNSIFISLFLFGAVFSQTARLQVIHNSADATAEVIDVWLDNKILLDNFSFRTASPFIDAPAGEEFTIAIKGPDSENPNNPIWSQNYTLNEGETYILVAEGIVSSTGYIPATPFDIAVYNMGREQSASDINTEILVHHGSTDAPTVDVYLSGLGVTKIVNDLMYSEFEGYFEYLTLDGLIVQIRDESGLNVFATYQANLAALGLEGLAVTAVASGFLDPVNNSNGPAFGLYVALPGGGDLVQLPESNANPFPGVIFSPEQDNSIFEFPNDNSNGIGDKIYVGTTNSTGDARRGLMQFSFDGIPESATITYAALTLYSFNQSNSGKSSNYNLHRVQESWGEGTSNSPNGRGVLANPGDATWKDRFYDVINPVEWSTVGGTFNSNPSASIPVNEGNMRYTWTSQQLTNDVQNMIDSPDNNFGWILKAADESINGLGRAFGSKEHPDNAFRPSLYVEFTTDGTPPGKTARVQVIHNAADPAAAVVDVYLYNNSTDEVVIKLDDFAFRSATAFLDAPAQADLSAIFALPGSTGPEDQVAAIVELGSLTPAKTYIAVANGVIGENFAANPDGRSIDFTVFAFDGIREAAENQNDVNFAIFHGASDAPAVDVLARGVTTLTSEAKYGDLTDYIAVPAAPYTIDITVAGDNQAIVRTFSVNLSALGGGAAIVFASGFLDPSANNDGPSFGLFAALPTGEVVSFPVITTARLQVIHNAADPIAASVDVYLYNESGDSVIIKLDDFSFRTATPFVDAPAGAELSAIFALPESTGPENAVVKTINIGALLAGETYVAIANGLVNPNNFEVNPDSRDRILSLFINSGVREVADSANVDLFVVHGATDAPTVDVIARGAGSLVDDAAYGDITGYISVPADQYILDITEGSNNNNIVASYDADLSSFSGQSLVVLASGFLSPENDENGEAFGLIAVTADGQTLPLSIVTSIERTNELMPLKYELGQNYPNPFNPTTTIRFSLPSNQQVKLSVFDISGRVVSTLVNDALNAGEYSFTFDAAQLSSGIYFYRIEADNFVQTKRMTLIK